MSRDFEWPEFVFLLAGLRWTVALALLAFAVGIAAGLVVALLRTSPSAPLCWIARCYIEMFQGTPLLMQLFLVYFGLAVLTGIQLDPWPAVATTFTLYAAAFLGEIWRGAIEAVPRSQWEAAMALALPRRIVLLRVVLPQALRIAIPPTVGFLVQLVKGTSVAAIIGFVELTRAGQLMVNVTFQPMIVYPIVAALYFAVCWPLSLLALRLERRMGVATSGSRTP